MILIGALVLSTSTFAQIKVGITAGASYNKYSMDLQYMTDFVLDGRWGTTFGVSGQYDLNEWFGIRADLNMIQKNYRRSRVVYSNVDYKFTNNYLQLPVMASFSFGGRKFRGFCNLGAYGGYWLSSHQKGSDIDIFSGYAPFSFDEKVQFMSERDQRWDCGLVGGLGMSYRIAPQWSVQAEVRYYYSTTSTTKQYMRVNDYRYNSTTAFQIGAYYHF